MNPVDRIARRDRKNANEQRRGTCVSDPILKNYDLSGGNSPVWVIDIDAGFTELVRDVIVQSQTGTGGRAYARTGKPISMQRNQGGRWICTGPSDRISTTGDIQFLTESTSSATAATPGVGFISTREPFEFYASAGRWANGSIPFNVITVADAQGNPV